MFEKSGNEDSRPEGSGASKIIAAIRKYGHNVDTIIEFATVTAPPPGLKIKIDNMGIELNADDLITAEHLTNYKRIVTIRPQYNSILGETVTTINGEGINFSMQKAELTFENVLKVGDRVIVASIDNGQHYVIFDRMVRY